MWSSLLAWSSIFSSHVCSLLSSLSCLVTNSVCRIVDNKIFIGNLSFETSREDVRQWISASVPAASMYVPFLVYHLSSFIYPSLNTTSHSTQIYQAIIHIITSNEISIVSRGDRSLGYGFATFSTQVCFYFRIFKCR